MTPAFEAVVKSLKRLPGLGYRSAERLALHLLVEKPERLSEITMVLNDAAKRIRQCPYTGNLCEGEMCAIYGDDRRNKRIVCIVESVPDLVAMEQAGAFAGTYHVLHGKLSPIRGVGPDDLNFRSFAERIKRDAVEEVILALSNDIEAEATCHYIHEHMLAGTEVKLSRIGFGLPSGGGITYADSATLKSSIEGRRDF